MKMGAFVGTLLLMGLLLFADTQLGSAPPHDQAKLIARGKYLVVDIGGCQDCHSPRDQQGKFIKDKWLQGSELFFKPVFPIPGWTSIAPGIAGLPNWTDRQALAFLTTGIAPEGTEANPPMPRYRYNHADADAVVAYLRSLKPSPQALSHTKSQPKQ